MQKSSVIQSATLSHNFIKKNLLRLALGMSLVTPLAHADQLYTDDVIVQASLCVGLDCVNGENFNYDTIRLKENNTRIKFHDSSSTSSFPSNDWQITANDSGNGGANKFSIEDISATKVPFTISAGAPDHSIFVKDNGYIGFNTSTPLVQMHLKDGNSPAFRLEQDGSSGFTSQSWDIAGNETNFFIRDVTNNSNIPFKIAPGASKNALFIANDGDVGLETQSPDGQFDVAHASDANNHAFLINPSSYVGVNIDNSYDPLGWFDVQTTGGLSKFLVDLNGNIGFGTGTTAVTGRFDVRSLDSTTNYFNIGTSGDIGIGTATPSAKLQVQTGDIQVTAGQLRVGAYNATAQVLGLTTLLSVKSAATQHALVDIDTTDTDTVTQLAFSSGGTIKWALGGRNSLVENAATLDRLSFYNAGFGEVMTIHQSGSIFIGTGAPNNNTTHQLQAASGAHLTTGGVWTSVSSREKKKNIREISMDDAETALTQLTPVQFEYIAQPDETYAGFISEDVPDIVATNDRKSLATMDIVAVLTKVVQKQQDTIEDLNKRLKELEAE